MEAVFGALWVPCLILSILGLAFLIAELFMPGFGVSGICGVLCLIAVCVIQFLTAKPLTAILVTAVLGAILIALVIAIPMGVTGAVRKGKAFDNITTTGTFLGISMPAFWMLLPYLLWCTFAAYLNCGIAILN